MHPRTSRRRIALSRNERDVIELGFGPAFQRRAHELHVVAGTLPSVQPCELATLLEAREVDEERLKVSSRLSQRQEPNILSTCWLPRMWNQPRSVMHVQPRPTFRLGETSSAKFPPVSVPETFTRVRRPLTGIDFPGRLAPAFTGKNLADPTAPASGCPCLVADCADSNPVPIMVMNDRRPTTLCRKRRRGRL